MIFRFAGYFQSNNGSISCISCDDIGDFYQENPGMSRCEPCPPNTGRYIDVKSIGGNNISSCQCKATYFRHDGLLGRECWACPEGGNCTVGALLALCCAHLPNESGRSRENGVLLSSGQSRTPIPCTRLLRGRERRRVCVQQEREDIG